jgi:hypothetical protein
VGAGHIVGRRISEHASRGSLIRNVLRGPGFGTSGREVLKAFHKQPTRRVLVHGLPYFGRMFATLMSGDGWEFRYHSDRGVGNLMAMARDLQACDIAYQIGGRVTLGKFLRAAKILRKKKVVMHWVGSDALDEQRSVAEGKSERWVTQGLHHWAVSEWMTREVRALGLRCELVPLSSTRIPDRPTPLPSKFSVLVYMPAMSRGWLYGLDRMLEVARKLPHVDFELVGLVEGSIADGPDNLHVHGPVPDLTEFYKSASVVWRPVRHDGLSCMVLEALGHGRHVLWSYVFPGCVHVNDAAEARDEISRLHALHQEGLLRINSEGVHSVTEGGYMPWDRKIEIRDRLEKILES